MIEEISIQRQIAAEQSKGISSDKAIYDLFLNLIYKCKLSGSVLDFGAGIGNFTRTILSLNIFNKVTAIDIMNRPINLDERVNWITLDLNEKNQLKDSEFDVIISPEVIEHLENAREVFRDWFRILKPGGKLLLSTPNNESIRALLALIFQGHFVYFTDNSYPAHISALLRKDFERICLETGFKKPQFYFTNNGGIPKMPYLKWQNVSFGILKGRLFSDNILIFTEKNT